MRLRIQKHNDGFALVLPPSITNQPGFAPDAEVDVTIENGAVVARPVNKPRYTLAELMAQITDGNKHPETDTGPAVGREEW